MNSFKNQDEEDNSLTSSETSSDDEDGLKAKKIDAESLTRSYQDQVQTKSPFDKIKIRKYKTKPKPNVKGPCQPGKKWNKYLTFCLYYRKELQKQYPTYNGVELTKMMGEKWRGMSQEEKQQWQGQTDMLNKNDLQNHYFAQQGILNKNGLSLVEYDEHVKSISVKDDLLIENSDPEFIGEKKHKTQLAYEEMMRKQNQYSGLQQSYESNIGQGNNGSGKLLTFPLIGSQNYPQFRNSNTDQVIFQQSQYVR
ncbi:UNKNOWN [Stylonychia lemnae]|uniref:HMG box domain-containing protein n=1 Tax=Stylonychia lemnae TaxID=5949 RepID=A0A078A8D8_STYLE|nr:UNKNOWN [Stylonychia lemnae]|eukprot:CDW78525.1 UNKNOWN [Stylonychia lemnae]